MGNRKRNQILGLDLLRAAAALLVLVFHYTYWVWVRDPALLAVWPTSFQAVAPVVRTFWVGVQIFFVLSGFVITYSSENITASAFVRHRIVRLLPSVLICATLTAAVLFAEKLLPFRPAFTLWLRSISFWPKGPWIDGSYWTLPVEASFYAIVFLCLLTGSRRLPLIMGALGLLSTAWNILLPQPRFPNATFLLTYGCFFVLGVFLYESLSRGFTLFRGAVLGLSLAGCLVNIGRSHQAWANPVWLAGLAVLILSVTLNNRAHELAGARGATLIRKVGLTTYPLYLLHYALGFEIVKALHRSANMSYPGAVLLASVLIITAATLIMQIAEPALASRLSALLGSKRQSKLKQHERPHVHTLKSSLSKE